VPIVGTMAFVRKKARRTKSGEVREYYYLVENRWEDGKVRQKVVEYLGTSPHRREVPVDPAVAGVVAQVIASGAPMEDMKKVLKKLGITVAGRLNQVSLTYKPPPQEVHSPSRVSPARSGCCPRGRGAVSAGSLSGSGTRRRGE